MTNLYNTGRCGNIYNRILATLYKGKEIKPHGMISLSSAPVKAAAPVPAPAEFLAECADRKSDKQDSAGNKNTDKPTAA
jgi:hypothetical protein